ncbi:hypothetical protein WA538_001653 [Blastocystis sp. DL]
MMITKPLSVVGFALKRAVTDESASAYSIFSDEGVDSLLPADVYNLFIVATIISLFVWFFRIAVKERHIKELGSHLASNNALVFDVLGTDVDILRQFTPEHLMKYLEYNSGCEPICIEQVTMPCTLNREDLHLETKEDGSKEIGFSVSAVSSFYGQLFWSVPASSYKRVCKELAKLICEKDPTFQRNFMNPFRGANDSSFANSFQSIMTMLRTNSKNGYSPVFSSSASKSFRLPVSQQMLQELPTYHLSAGSFSIFSEKLSDLQMLHSVSSQSSLLQLNRPSSVFNSRNEVNGPTSMRPSANAVPSQNEIIPLVLVLWDEPSSSAVKNEEVNPSVIMY